MYLPLSTVARAVSVVDVLGELTTPGEFPVVLPALHRLIPGDTVVWSTIGLDRTDVRYRDFPPRALDEARCEVFASLLHEHPLITHFRRTGDPRALRISDFVSTAEFHRLALYREFFRAIGVERQLAVTIAPPEGVLSVVAFNRAGGDFTDVERDLLTLLREPMAAALRRARRREHASLVLAGPLHELTGRERQVIELVALGRTNAGIARALQVSPRTVAKHLEHIYHKLRVTNRVAAAGRMLARPPSPERLTEPVRTPD
ncbi:helix-turn-helix transcriptional regulator [Amycolatopsis cynarae]|uniref:Helix-turn-helix transcriptional regulator n=1 Tax=Amycolatopsis cynarae TaxID=2995223 RepID=A0ABY7B4D0_9PSEU|nr:helix-turn-helix transcriptional regulator [Amycolatopsis sp. HUAS 11-8]WAL66794.1 helix-turn-helix transcriptional regulator [Amycolatopsis sp. HUAS 11-8]